MKYQRLFSLVVCQQFTLRLDKIPQMLFRFVWQNTGTKHNLSQDTLFPLTLCNKTSDTWKQEWKTNVCIFTFVFSNSC